MEILGFGFVVMMNSLFLVPGTLGLGFKFVGTQEESSLNSWKSLLLSSLKT